jgi:hypothetical protein
MEVTQQRQEGRAISDRLKYVEPNLAQAPCEFKSRLPQLS